jgi:hypothetical protein
MGEFFYVGTLGECAQELERVSKLHPEWKLSMHRLWDADAASKAEQTLKAQQ